MPAAASALPAADNLIFTATPGAAFSGILLSTYMVDSLTDTGAGSGLAGCLAFHEGKRPVRTASVTQVRQPIYQRSVARWRHYEKSLGPLFDRLEDGSAAVVWLEREGPPGSEGPAKLVPLHGFQRRLPADRQDPYAQRPPSQVQERRAPARQEAAKILLESHVCQRDIQVCLHDKKGREYWAS